MPSAPAHPSAPDVPRAAVVAPGEIGTAAVAVLALLLGAACYPLLRGAAPWLPGAGQLPALLHAFGFALLMLLVVRPWPTLRAAIAVGWFALLGIGEAVQLLDPVTVGAVLSADGTWAAGSALQWVPEQAILAHAAGTFDPFDLLASAVGVSGALLWRWPGIPEG
jgi:hypothetical protein